MTIFETMRDTRALGLAALLALPIAGLAGAPEAAAQVGVYEDEEAPEREQIPWDLSDMYESREDWEASRENVLDRIPELEGFEGRLSEGPETMLEALETMSEVTREGENVYVYSNLLFDENQANSDAAGMTQQANEMFAAMGRATSWINPEIIELGPERIEEYIASDPEGFAPFAHQLRNTVRNAQYILSPEGEAIMAAAGILNGQPRDTYDLLTNSDIEWPTITLSTGEEVVINHAGYAFHRAAQNREDRQAVFDAYWGTWMQYRATVGQILNSHIQNQVFISRARGYDNTLQMNLFASNLPEGVYTTLTDQVNEMLPLLHRYFRLRARLLGVDDFSYSDIYPEALEIDREFTFYDSRDAYLEIIEPMGDEYHDLAEWATGQGWEHVYPQDGKENGAYQWGTYDSHPYLLLNHQDDYGSLSTYVHEWGHAMHSLLTRENQPYENSGYDTFIAEVASISQEILLEEYLIENAQSDEERLFYVDRILEGYRGTLFRQTMFAEFERAAYVEVEEGRPLTGERLAEIYLEIVRRYHGVDQGVMSVDDEIGMEWAFVGHFYRNYYVFQYSTSQVQADYFVHQLQEGAPNAQENFLNLLRAGGSDYPYNIVMNSGLDMASPEAYTAARDRMTRMLDMYEDLLDRMGY